MIGLDWTQVPHDGDRALYIAVEDTPDGPLYHTKVLLPPDEWEQHKTLTRELAE